MVKCPQDKIDSALHRATVNVCPRCGRILDADELLGLLRRLGFSKKLIQQVQDEIKNRNLVKAL